MAGRFDADVEVAFVIACPIDVGHRRGRRGLTVGMYPWFADLGTIERVPFAEAAARYRFTPPEGVYLEDMEEANDFLFGGRVEEVFVYRGSVHRTGNLCVGSTTRIPYYRGGDCGIYVIDGDLTVDGVLSHTESDQGSLLMVTGDVRVNALVVDDDAHLYIGRSLRVDGVLIANLADGGTLSIAGPTYLRTGVHLRHDSVITFGHPPVHVDDPDRQVTMLEKPHAEVIAPEFLDADGYRAVWDRLHDALLAGRPVLRTPTPA
jgi:hypothetical protein